MAGGFEDKTSVSILDNGQEPAPDEGLDDFATLADSYLLSDPALASEFAAVEDVLQGSLPRLPADSEPSRDHNLDPFAWDPSSVNFRNSSLGNWEASNVRQMIQKVRAENGDSNDWEQVREHGSGMMNAGKSESPNSGHIPTSSTALPAARPNAMERRVQNAADLPKQIDSSFVTRTPGSDTGHHAFEAEKQHLPQSFSRLLQTRSGGLDHQPEAYERPRLRHSSFSSPACPPSVFAGPHSHMHGHQGVWQSDLQDGPGWTSARGSQMGMGSYGNPDTGMDNVVEYTPPDRRHSMGDVLEEPTSAEHHLRARAASSVDNVNALGPKMEQLARTKGSGQFYMPHMSPLLSPQQPSTPSEAFSSERKRKRPADGLFPPTPGPTGPQASNVQPSRGGGLPSHLSSSSSPTAHDDLVRTLKNQIEGIDAHTKAVMKDTLYRISRNTNTENGGISAPRPRQSSRNQYLDKLVANFLYNRFEYTDGRAGPWAAPYPSYGDQGYRVSSLESIKP